MFKKLFGKRKPAIPLEDQLESIQSIGIRLKSGFNQESLLNEFGRNEYEKNPYELLLVAMGSEIETVDNGWVYLSNDIWHFDTECIEDHGDYVRIAERLRDLAKGNLPIENLKDFVDIEEGQAWIAFSLQGKDYKWDLHIEDDWVDPNIFFKFSQLIMDQGYKNNFVIAGLGQDCLITYCNPEQLDTLNVLTGLKFDWVQKGGKVLG